MALVFLPAPVRSSSATLTVPFLAVELGSGRVCEGVQTGTASWGRPPGRAALILCPAWGKEMPSRTWIADLGTPF